jgi:catechol 2,3-dioxygenase-like lactoylglutathione lyase family enzyme
MKINRIDHVGINVEDLAAAKEFFLTLGLTVLGEMEMKGELVERVTGLSDVRDTIVMLGIPGGEKMIELVKFYKPLDEKGVQQSFSNTLGIRHICFAVEDLEALVAKLQKKGAQLVGEIQTYENIYKLCYIRGPEGIILELAEKLN